MKVIQDKKSIVTAETLYSDLDMAYLAGVIDSDGSLSIMRRHPNRKLPNFSIAFQLTWKHTEKTMDFINALQKTFGGSFHINTKHENRLANNDVVKYFIMGNPCMDLLLGVRDYLILKAEQADNLIELQNLKNYNNDIEKMDKDFFKEYQNDLYNFNKELNRKG